MDKTELVEKFKTETGFSLERARKTGKVALLKADYIKWLEAQIPTGDKIAVSAEYLRWLEAKAEAYDRLMGHKKTLKDLANVLHRPVAMDKYGVPLAFNDIPIAGREGWIYEQDQAKTSYVLRGDPIRTVVDYDFSGDWKDSLTLPDTWEDKQ